jgi:Spy/CpxP family protein refolding chaperone
MLNRSKLWAAILLLGVFAAGVAIGGTAWSALGNNRPGDRGGGRGGAPELRDREHRSYSDDLQEQLGLTAAQRAAIDSILESSQPEMHSAWRQMRARIDTLRQSISNQVMEVLDEQQQAQYRELLARSRRRGDRERAPRDNRYHE